MDGLTESIVSGAVVALFTAVGAMWSAMKQRLDTVDKEQATQNDRLARVEVTIHGQAERFERIENKLDRHDEKLDRLLTMVSAVSRS